MKFRSMLLISLFILFLTPFSCSAYMLMKPGEYAAYEFGKQVGEAANLLRKSKQLQENFTTQLRVARSKFWQCNSECTEADDLKKEFVSLLYEKDYHFLNEDTYGQGMVGMINIITGTEDIDGGIRKRCRNSFNSWSTSVTSKYPVEQAKKDLAQGRFSTATVSINTAIESAEKSGLYSQYVACRDQWEYDARPFKGEERTTEEYLYGFIKWYKRLETRQDGQELLEQRYYPKYGKLEVFKIAELLLKTPKKKTEKGSSWKILAQPQQIGCSKALISRCFEELLKKSYEAKQQSFTKLGRVTESPSDFNDLEAVARSMKEVEAACKGLPKQQANRTECINTCKQMRERLGISRTQSDWNVCLYTQDKAFGLAPKWWDYNKVTTAIPKEKVWPIRSEFSKDEYRQQMKVVHPDTLSVLLMKQYGLPEARSVWIQLMRLRRHMEFYDRKYSKLCGPLVFESDDFTIYDFRNTREVPDEAIEKFKTWTKNRIENLDDKLILELQRQGPPLHNLRNAREFLVLMDFRKKNYSNRKQVEVNGFDKVYKVLGRGDKKEIGFATEKSAKSYTLRVHPDEVSSLPQKGGFTQVNSLLKFSPKGKNPLQAKVLESRLLLKGTLVKKKDFENDEEEDQSAIFFREKQLKYLAKYHAKAAEEKESFQKKQQQKSPENPVVIEKNKERSLAMERRKQREEKQQQELQGRQQRIKIQRIQSERAQKANFGVSRAGIALYRSDACNRIRRENPKGKDLPQATVFQNFDFSWSESKHGRQLKNADWGTRGKPENPDGWYLLKTSVSINCFRRSAQDVKVAIIDYLPCKEPFCMEYEQYEGLFK